MKYFWYAAPAGIAAMGVCALWISGCDAPQTAGKTGDTTLAMASPDAPPSVAVSVGPPTPAATVTVNAQGTGGPPPFKSLGKIQKTTSGLTIDDMTLGDGGTPKSGQYVQVHYSGTTKDGAVFDESYKRGQPIEFPLGQGAVIKGWDEGIASMKVGGRRKLVIPGDLAYGEAPPPGSPFKPNETLYFDVQLVGLSDTPQQK